MDIKERDTDIKEWNTDIKERVHGLYWDSDVNCARTTLICMGERFRVEYSPQTLAAAIGLHGAGGYGAQCGLVEGGLMFLGIYFKSRGWKDKEIADLCFRYADEFAGEFGSLLCCELRPGGFRADDPPHLCENLTWKSIEFLCVFTEREDRI